MNDDSVPDPMFRGGGVLSISSTISGNTAVEGGGIWNVGFFDLTNSTISGNHATTEGGGIYAGFLSYVQINNTTIANNTGAFPGSGPGIFNDASSVKLFNSIVADNTIGTTAVTENCFVAPISTVLYGDTVCSPTRPAGWIASAISSPAPQSWVRWR